MKASSKLKSFRPRPQIGKKNLTLGQLIADTYRARGKQAAKILQLAMESRLVRLSRPQPVM